MRHSPSFALRCTGILASFTIAVGAVALAHGASSVGASAASPVPAQSATAPFASARSTPAKSTSHPHTLDDGSGQGRGAMRMLDEPGGGYRLLPGRRIVAFYGEADAPELGVLGDAPPGVLWKRLAAQASVYDRPGVPAIPSYELIAFAAQASAGPGDLYTARISDSVISSYLRVVQAHHGLLILDIQPGRSDFLADAKTLAHWLAFPDVALALDPEWVLRPGQLPLAQIGSTTAAVVNQVSAWLEALVVRQELPQKLLIIHDFTPTMVVHESGVALEAHLAIVFNMDGFGAQPNKVAAYEQLAEDHHYYFGFKLFLTRDIDMFTPAEVMGLKPSPSVIEYE